MLSVTAAKMVHSKVPISDYALKHFDWYLTNNSNNIGLQCLNRRLWTLRSEENIAAVMESVRENHEESIRRRLNSLVCRMQLGVFYVRILA